MMTKKSIPDQVKAEVTKIITVFNQEVCQQYGTEYLPRYRGQHLYLDRVDDMGNQEKICRLTYTGDLNHWDFAIYKYSDSCYDPDEWIIPGMEKLDGTIVGAMKTGLEAYPP